MSNFITCTSVPKLYDVSLGSKDSISFDGDDFICENCAIFSPPILNVKIEKQGPVDYRISFRQSSSHNNSPTTPSYLLSDEYSYKITSQNITGTACIIKSQDYGIAVAVSQHKELVGYVLSDQNKEVMIPGNGRTIVAIVNVPNGLVEMNKAIDGDIYIVDIYGCNFDNVAGVVSYNYASVKVIRNNTVHPCFINKSTILEPSLGSTSYLDRRSFDSQSILESAVSVRSSPILSMNNKSHVDDKECVHDNNLSCGNICQSQILNNNIIPKPIQRNKVKIPDLIILTRDNIGSTDIGEVCFTVHDQYDYERHKITDNTCRSRWLDPNSIKLSKFRRCSPYIAPFLRGEGETAREKADYIWLKEDLSKNITEREFYARLITYSMLKYILCRLLYGRFDLNLLFGQYHCKFMADLNCSRFWNFVDKFEDPSSEIYGYESYFIWTS